MAAKIEDIYAKALVLSIDVEDNFFDLARMLRELLNRDPDLFKQVIDKSNLGVRKGYYLVSIAKHFGSLKFNRARLRRVGWTKLMLLGPQVTQDNVDELLTLAEQNNAAQLKLLMKGEQPRKNARVVNMYFTESEYAALEAVLIKNGARRIGRGVVDKEAALLRALKLSR